MPIHSKEILDDLIRRRLEPDADVEAIDANIRERFEETWAVVFTDLVGFSRRTEKFGILQFLSVIYRKGELMRPVVNEHGGLIVKEEADSWLMLFRDVQRAVDCMIACQRACEGFNLGRREEDKVELCVGVGYGKILKIGDEDIWGREVNYASKLGEDTARHMEILLTQGARDAIGAPDGLDFEAESVSFGTIELPYYRTKYSLDR